MNPRELPIISYVIEAGADDKVLDGLLLFGPLVIGLIVVLGRSLATELLALVYIAVFIGYVPYHGIQ